MTQRAYSVKSKPDVLAPTTDAALTPSTDVNLFRIKIWYEEGNNEIIVYDNRPDLGDDEYGGTEIGGGNIKVHNK